MKVKITKLGEGTQLPGNKIPFFLVPGYVELKISENVDATADVSIINSKAENVVISVTTKPVVDWIGFYPVLLLRPYEVKRVNFTFIPQRIKNAESEIDIVFKADDYVQNVRVKVALAFPAEGKDIIRDSQQRKGERRVEKKNPVEVRVYEPVWFYTVHVASFKTLGEAKDHLSKIPQLEPKISVILYDLDKKGLWYRVCIGLYRTKEESGRVANHFINFFGFGYSSPLMVREDVFNLNVVR